VADVAVPVTAPVAVPVDPGRRGRLDIHDRVIERVVRRAALGVPGVVRHQPAASRVVGGGLPRVHLTVAHGHVSVAVDVAVSWPRPVAATAAAVRERVRGDVRAFTGLVVDSAHVSVAALVVPVERPATYAPEGPDGQV
jgi:uncharacterized alkaline shock family protein YloU